MPGVTLTSLVDEALTFHHDGNLLGFCLDNPDEPFKDSFEDRCHDKLVGRWIDSREGFCTPQDLFVGDADDETEVDEDGYDADDEVRTPFAQFCDMSSRKQALEVNRLKHLICEFIGFGVTICDFEAPDAFILEAIQDGLDDEELCQQGKALYYGLKRRKLVLTAEDKLLVVKVEKMEDHYDFGTSYANDDVIRIGQMSVERGLPNIGKRNLSWAEDRRDHRQNGPRSVRCRRPASYGISGKSHCEKYGRQDYRHQLPRHEANDERRIAQYEALMEAQFARWEAERECDLEPLPVVHMSVRQQMLTPLWELRGSDITMQDVAELGDYLDEQRRIMDDMLLLFHGSYEWRDTVPDYALKLEFTQEDVRNGRNRRWSEPVRRRRVGAFDRYDDYTDVGCSCDICLMGGYNNDDYWASDIGDVRFDEDIDVRDEWPSWYEMMWDLHDEDESEQREIFRAESVPLQCSSQRVTSTHRKLSGRDMMALF